jgi:hypothetical protein
LLWKLSVLMSLAYLREDFLWLRLCRGVIFCGYSVSAQFFVALRQICFSTKTATVANCLEDYARDYAVASSLQI